MYWVWSMLSKQTTTWVCLFTSFTGFDFWLHIFALWSLEQIFWTPWQSDRNTKLLPIPVGSIFKSIILNCPSTCHCHDYKSARSFIKISAQPFQYSERGLKNNETFLFRNHRQITQYTEIFTECQRGLINSHNHTVLTWSLYWLKLNLEKNCRLF